MKIYEVEWKKTLYAQSLINANSKRDAKRRIGMGMGTDYDFAEYEQNKDKKWFIESVSEKENYS